jgi:amidase
MDDIERTMRHGSIAEIGALLAANRLSSVELVGWCLARIEADNRRGLELNAVRTLSPSAVAAARRADAERAAGQVRGPLHGIPFLLKDNILTDDGLVASAGAAALADFTPRREATLARRLREAGALLLGKSNMTELADYVSDVMPSGFSGAGGMVRNPHGGVYGRGQGSSVGSAAAVAAGFVPFAIGTETQNSIQSPACNSGVVGFKPTVGVVSRSGVVPLVPSQDSPGPITRSVDDAALVLAAIAGADCRDAATLALPFDARTATPLSLSGVRIGVARRAVADRTDFAPVMPAFEAALSRLSASGACIVDPCDLPSGEQLHEVRSSVFRTEFKAALDDFFEEHGAPCGIASLAALIAWNEAHPECIPYGQALLVAAGETAGLRDARYRDDRARDLMLSREGGIVAALRGHRVDVLVAPMGAAAKCTGKAGAPVVAIPAGRDAAGAPFGITLFAAPGQDGLLLAVGAAVERALAGVR